jgi:hypothetical protein
MKAYVGQEQVSRGITDFYKELISAQPTQKKNYIKFYVNCPKLSDEQVKFLDKDLNLKYF